MQIEMVSASLYYDLFEKYQRLINKPEDKHIKKINRLDAKAVLDYLNELSGKRFAPVDANLSLISSRLKEGATIQMCKDVVFLKVADWNGTDMANYLRPATLFNKSKFWQYHGEIG